MTALDHKSDALIVSPLSHPNVAKMGYNLPWKNGALTPNDVLVCHTDVNSQCTDI